MDERDNIGDKGYTRCLINYHSRSEFNGLAIWPFQDLAGKNSLNVTDIKYFSDYIRAKYEHMQNIVSDSFRRTRSK